MNTRLRGLRSVAIVSLTLTAVLTADARPRYGGTLRIQLASPVSALRQSALSHLTAETLTQLNAAGAADPLLATSWSSERGGRRWRFNLRAGVMTHDGSPLTPAAAATRIEGQLKSAGMDVVATPDGLTISAATPIADLPIQLSQPAFSIAGTGPFVPAEDGALVAFENHWAGRPFVDRIEFLPPRTGVVTVSNAEGWEIPIGPGRRGVPEGLSTWSSAPIELFAVEFVTPDPTAAAALSASVDRESIAAGLTQRRGIPAGSLLPDWITGYSFLFSSARDVTRARTLVAAMRLAPMVLSYDPADPIARIVADRVALNARDAGITIQVRPDAAAQLRIHRWIANPNAALALDQLGKRPASNDPEAIHAAERALINEGRLVPIMHLPLIFGFGPRVQLPEALERVLPRLPLADVWLTQ
jgi:peptide/nickel transport system substrate-binding protein